MLVGVLLLVRSLSIVTTYKNKAGGSFVISENNEVNNKKAAIQHVCGSHCGVD